MFNRRDFIKTTALAANVGMFNPINVFAASTRETTGFFGAHPFIDQHPDAVFIMYTNVDVETNDVLNLKEGSRLANEVIVPKDKTGIPTSHLIPIKTNMSGLNTDPYFVEGFIEGMKQTGIPGNQFHIRDINTSATEKNRYTGVAKRTGADFHTMTQGKIERYHRSLKNVVNLQHYYLPGELEQEIEGFVEYYNNQRYHESLDNLTPADVYSGRKRECLSVRKIIKQNTMKLRRAYNLGKGGLKKHLLIVKSIP